ncbi:hypothetical protein [Xenorhabdus cabanillasii]|uniref:Uncharacterized protein n=1 Tax=Xenorhabdus cabanillasii JM26 TaxID=1427517 RepID=W1JAP6_9GAMM|nr:hypothetical protein [Xenorhabdus cabanillasii]PHM78330.1 hypothetical protein Xcab_01183 [Xenorhabdus cabanillasii JM26]CDL86941.1 hypothetical protein XCR1_800036 [Xenorhabdus cabanillasii JM26]
MITEIPLDKTPNQAVSFSLESDNYDLILETRLGNLFATVKKKTGNIWYTIASAAI